MRFSIAIFLLSALPHLAPAQTTTAPDSAQHLLPAQPGALAALRDYAPMRSSSEDRLGNDDWTVIAAGETTTIAQLQGPGEITHLWTTIDSPDPHHLNNIIIRIYWDGNAFPSVEAPIGDFFGLGHGMYYYFDNPVQAIGTNKGMNSFWPMPFAKSARIEITNESDHPVAKFYYYVDWRKFDVVTPGFGYFHAQYRQEFPCVSGRNYLFFETAGGPGHFAGVHLSVHTQVDGWWGEGDDIFTIDGEQRPSIWGTGSEDYFSGAWGYGEVFYNDYFGMPLRTRMDQDANNFWNVYRHHLENPVTFKKSIKVEMEHGHDGVSNERGGKNNNYSSVAYYYVAQPQPLGDPLPPAAHRWPQYASPSAGPGIIEAQYMERSKPEEGSLDAQGLDADHYKQVWLNDNQLFRDNPPHRDVTELSFHTTGTLQGEAVLLMTAAPDYGQVKIELNGKTVAEKFDGYAGAVRPVLLPIGPQDLLAGKQTLKITIIGKNTQSTGHRWGIDYLRVGGQPVAVEEKAAAPVTAAPGPSITSVENPVELITPAGAQGWQVTGGHWTQTTSESITAAGDFDNRLITTREFGRDIETSVTIALHKGWSAGALVWAAADAQRGYAVRLDSRQGKLLLEKIGPWPEVEELDSYPWGALDGDTVDLKIVAAGTTIRAYAPALGKYPVLEALNVEPAGTHLGLQIIDAEATFVSGQVSPVNAEAIVAHVPKVSDYQHVYDPSVGESSPWYINDHCFIKSADAWHLFGITHTQPGAPMDELNFAHAVSSEFPGSLQTWKKQPYALTADPAAGEQLLWAPYVIKRGDTWYMFYCAGSQQGGSHFRIHLATSPDLKTWTRHGNNPVFQDTFDARDPMVLEDSDVYYMYYTANLGRNKSHHTVHLRTSSDLINWSPATIALVHPAQGTVAGPTESPYVVKHGSHFYLFIGPAGEYHRTTVYRSPNPLHWNIDPEVAAIPSHAAEVIQDDNGNWFASDSGWDKTGVYLAPLTWEISK